MCSEERTAKGNTVRDVGGQDEDVRVRRLDCSDDGRPQRGARLVGHLADTDTGGAQHPLC